MPNYSRVGLKHKGRIMSEMYQINVTVNRKKVLAKRLEKRTTF
jgi:hypothetical protein